MKFIDRCPKEIDCMNMEWDDPEFGCIHFRYIKNKEYDCFEEYKGLIDYE